MEPKYYLPRQACATAHPCLDNDTLRQAWRSFCLTEGALTLRPTDRYTFCLGGETPPTLPEGSEFSLCVSERGVGLTGRDVAGLTRGFSALLLQIEYDGQDRCYLRHGAWQSHYRLQNRMLHLCIFPENDLYFIQKMIRLAGLCQYTHIVLEFWGMFPYQCLPVLAWPCAFHREQIRALIEECRALGMEPIPMFNQLGHATASRACYGKHVVLDQDPRLQRLFTPDGWVWNIRSPEVTALLRQVRAELYDVFGPGQYMHLGCDEAYAITHDPALRAALPEYLSALTAEVEAEGRHPMLWMDMLLEEGRFPHCYAVSREEEAPRLRAATAPSTVFVDWQYDCRTAPVPSLLSLKDSGHACMGAPWYDAQNYAAHIQTVADNGLHGIMLTTWHTLKERMPSILDCAEKCGAITFPWGERCRAEEETAALLRRVSWEGNDYANSGWAKAQIEV